MNFLNTGLLLPLRVYWYAGSIPALFYYPLYLLWTAPISARLLGVLWLLVQAGILSRVFRIRFGYIFAGLIVFFPYFFQHIADTGPVAIQITSVYLLYALFSVWCREQRMLHAVLVALILFVCIWTKLVYLWLLPGLAVLFAFAVHEECVRTNGTMSVLCKQCGVCVALVLGLLSLLFFSTDPFVVGEYPYITTLLNGNSLSIAEILQNFWSLDAVRLLLNPLEASHRIFHIAPAGVLTYIYDAVLFGGLPALLALAYSKTVRTSALRKSAAMYGLFLLTFFFVLRSEEVWAMHHVILSFPFLVLGYLLFFSDWKMWKSVSLGRVSLMQITTVLVCVFVVLNALWFTTFYRQPVRSMADVSRNSIHKILNDPYLANNYIYISLENGLYFYQALYGHRDQSITFKNPLTEDWQISQIKEWTAQNNRKVLFVYDTVSMYSDYDLIHRNFQTVPCLATDQSWAWQIFLEDDGSSENICL